MNAYEQFFKQNEKEESSDIFFGKLRQLSNAMDIDGKIVSPKRDFIINKIISADKRSVKSLIYSEFLENGIELIAEALEEYGIKYSKITGETKLVKERTRAVERFNRNETEVMLISGASVTGIDLKGTRMVFLLEPFWNENELEQAKSRAIRYGSHTNLPKNEQNVTVYTLILDKPLPD